MSRSHVSKFATDFFAAELRAWRGEQPLWKVFWVYGVATAARMKEWMTSDLSDLDLLVIQIDAFTWTRI